jgi:hypothetical protein
MSFSSSSSKFESHSAILYVTKFIFFVARLLVSDESKIKASIEKYCVSFVQIVTRYLFYFSTDVEQ